ncbi:MAG: hypothetical protein PUC06_11710 [Oscillospiraceae bacterium]|nr:hypothetical protein [Oscillospiraceae bacterium]
MRAGRQPQSFWQRPCFGIGTATGDSTVTLGQTVDVCQIDAPAGVTITAVAADGQGTYTLASGGTLIVE